ncbi:hypothetical protein NDU88_005522 [Pleurodeles waltl]|uniref:Uncharacterized protein n=1 Tax=Pleurodeles waltl TaxID=8319 RepID=A0AAV7W826_PLEWA|nr:hypothetical protein NDU88_005522 [Pleurodeles waltl]
MIDTLLATIGSTQDALESKIDTLVVDMRLFRDDECKMADRIKEVGTDLGTLGPMSKLHAKELDVLVGPINVLETFIEDLDARARRNNGAIEGLTEFGAVSGLGVNRTKSHAYHIQELESKEHPSHTADNLQ